MANLQMRKAGVSACLTCQRVSSLFLSPFFHTHSLSPRCIQFGGVFVALRFLGLPYSHPLVLEFSCPLRDVACRLQSGAPRRRRRSFATLTHCRGHAQRSRFSRYTATTRQGKAGVGSKFSFKKPLPWGCYCKSFERLLILFERCVFLCTSIEQFFVRFVRDFFPQSNKTRDTKVRTSSRCYFMVYIYIL